MQVESFKEPNDGDFTRRTRIIVRKEMEIVKTIKFWAVVAISTAGVGFTAATYMNKYAATSHVEKLSTKIDSVSQELNKHILEESSRLSAVEASAKNIEEDYHWQREQLQKIADRIGAERVADPAHVRAAAIPTSVKKPGAF